MQKQRGLNLIAGYGESAAYKSRQMDSLHSALPSFCVHCTWRYSDKNVKGFKYMIISDSKGGTVATGIDRLYDYTKFHVGLYISLVFGVVALISIGNGEALRNSIVLMFAIFAIMSWVVSGFAGGVILGTLVDQNCSLKKFQESKWGPSGAKWMTGRSWESLEHYSFWVGVVLALTAFTFAVFFILSPPDVAAVIDTESHKCI